MSAHTALTESAERVCRSLRLNGFDAVQGRNRRTDTVVIRYTHESQRATIDHIAQKAADPHYCDVRGFSSYFTLMLKLDRAVFVRERWVERHGEFGSIVRIGADGVVEEIGDHHTLAFAVPPEEPYA